MPKDDKNAKEIKTIADLKPDSTNARKHNPRNVGMIEASLHEVGAARSIVVDEDGVILAGNATIEAAGNAGIGKVQIVDADGETIIAVRRSGLTKAQKKKLALFDNRTAELADWDAATLAKLVEQDGELVEGMWTEEEMEDLLENPSGDVGASLERIYISKDRLPIMSWVLIGIPTVRFG